MLINTERKNLNLNSATINDMVSTWIEQDIIVPDTKPDAVKIVSVSVTPYISDFDVYNDKIKIDGKINYFVIYKVADEKFSTRGLYVSHPYTQVINVPGVTKDMNITIEPSVKNIIHSLPNERKIAVKTEVIFKVVAKRGNNISLVNKFDTEDKIECKMCRERFNNMMCFKRSIIASKEDVVLPSDAEDLFEILKVDANIINTEYKESYNKIMTKGDIEVKILVDRYGIKAPDIVFDNMQTYGFSDGGRWTDVQEKEGAKVALFWDFNNPIYNGVDITNPTVALNKDNTVTIDNKKYEIIGYQNYCYAPIIPYSSLDVSATFTKCTFTFFEHISMTSYETLNRILKEELGDNFAINRTSSPRKNNVHYIYGVVFLIVGFVAFIAIVDLMLLYRYYLRKVKYKAAIFRLCGMPLTKSICLQIGEFLLLSLPIYICAAIFFSSILLPRLRPYYVYMPNAFNVSVYGILFGIYIIFSLTFCLVITWYENHKSIVNMLL